MSICLSYYKTLNHHHHYHHHHHHRRNLKAVNCNLNSTLQVRNEATAAGSAPARESIWHYFVNKCANNLHVVLAMSPVGDTLRTRCRNFPGRPLFSYFTSHHHSFHVFLKQQISLKKRSKSFWHNFQSCISASFSI